MSIGSGPPLMVLLFTPEAGELSGLTRWSLMRLVRPFAEHFTVRVPNRAPGLPPDTTMAELAAHYADAVTGSATGPVHVLGLSTGGSLALQLAADRPELVDRLVLGATAHSPGAVGERAQRAYVERARRGRRPSSALAEAVTGSPMAQAVLRPVLWLSDGRTDHTDAATMLNAENNADLRERLHGIRAPTLLIHGERDLVYPRELAELTAESIPDARLVSYPGRGHAGTLRDRRFARNALAFLAAR